MKCAKVIGFLIVDALISSPVSFASQREIAVDAVQERIPLSGEIQSVDKEFFEDLKNIEADIAKILKRINEFENLQQGMPQTDNNKEKFIDYHSYRATRMRFLEDLRTEWVAKLRFSPDYIKGHFNNTNSVSENAKNRKASDDKPSKQEK
jgi:hypothetical protein